MIAPAGSHIALVGNPNCGKTTIFNALTGLRQKVGNYPGVTVEKKEGRALFSDGSAIQILDLPGTYSLTAISPDEKVVTEILLGERPETPRPAGIVCIVDASRLERSLYLVSQIIDLQYPLCIVLNMTDVAERGGVTIDAGRLSAILGVPVIPVVGNKGSGIGELKSVLRGGLHRSPAAGQWTLPELVAVEHLELTGLLVAKHEMSEIAARQEAMALLSTPRPLDEYHRKFHPEILEHVCQDHRRIASAGIDRHAIFIESRFRWIRPICRQVTESVSPGKDHSDRIDAIVTHRIWGFIIFLILMLMMFESIFTWAAIPMHWIGAGFDAAGQVVGTIIPPGDLHDLAVHGVISGVGAVVTFLPQILLLFFFLGILEESGYMARAALIMDRLMNAVGLHGKSFIPILSSFACAIPGIMATRTIENPRDRLATMLVAPLASCSARLPVYSLLIAAFIPPTLILGIWNLQGIVMVSLYLLGVVMALAMAWLFRRTILRGRPTPLIIELPPYRIPSFRNILLQMWERSFLFLKRAGTIILGVSILLWFAATYPKMDHGTPSERLAHSFVGRAGHLIEPVIRPLGFDWKIGIGILTSLLQREVFVSSISTIYNIETTGEHTVSLREQIDRDKDPVTGKPNFSTLTAICVMVYYVLAMQCMSTVAIMRRETNGWKWPLFQIAYMTGLAWVVTLAVFRIGLMLG